MSETVVKIYKCYKCGNILYERTISEGETCKCGSNKVQLVQPTFYQMVRFFLHNPSYIKIFVRENVIGRA